MIRQTAEHLSDQLAKAAEMVVQCLRAGGGVFVFGNGGSAADAQHFTAELVCRFEKNRAALPAIALTTNSSILTAIGNDFTFDDLFSRQCEAWLKPGDLAAGGHAVFSPHDLGIEQSLKLMAVIGQAPAEVVIIGIEPEEIAWGTELSRTLQARIPEIVKTVLREIGLGIT